MIEARDAGAEVALVIGGGIFRCAGTWTEGRPRLTGDLLQGSQDASRGQALGVVELRRRHRPPARRVVKRSHRLLLRNPTTSRTPSRCAGRNAGGQPAAHGGLRDEGTAQGTMERAYGLNLAQRLDAMAAPCRGKRHPGRGPLRKVPAPYWRGILSRVR